MRPPWTTPAQARRKNGSREAHHRHLQAPCERLAARLPRLSRANSAQQSADTAQAETRARPGGIGSAAPRGRGNSRHHIRHRRRALRTPSLGCRKLGAAARILPFRGAPRQATARIATARAAGAHAARKRGGGTDAAPHGRVRARTETTSTERKNAMACPLEASPRLRPREICWSRLPYVWERAPSSRFSFFHFLFFLVPVNSGRLRHRETALRAVATELGALHTDRRR